MNHPIAFIFIARIKIIVAYIKELLNVIREIIDEGIALPNLIEYNQWKFIWTRRRHIAFRSKQWTCILCTYYVCGWRERERREKIFVSITRDLLFTFYWIMYL